MKRTRKSETRRARARLATAYLAIQRGRLRSYVARLTELDLLALLVETTQARLTRTCSASGKA